MNILLLAIFSISIITYFHHTKYISNPPRIPGSTSSKEQLNKVLYLCRSSKYILLVVYKPVSILLSTTNKMQRYTLFFIIVKLYMFRAVSPPIIRSSRTVHIVPGTCQACFLLPVAASKPGTYQMLCVQFLGS